MLNREAIKNAIAKIRITLSAQDNGCLTDEETFKLIANEVIDAAGVPIDELVADRLQTK